MDQQDDIERAIAYCDTLAPGFSSRIRGAPAAVIDKVAARLRRPLAAPHRRFLERMGELTGGLDFGELDTSAQGLADGLAATYGTPLAGFELFGIGVDEPYEDLYLVERAGVRTLEFLNSRVGTTHDTLAGDAGTIAAATIAEFICSSMLRRHVVARMPHRQGYLLQRQDDAAAPYPAALDSLDRIAAGLGLERLWFSSQAARFHAAEGLVLTARQGERTSFVLTVTADDREAIATADEALVRGMHLKRLR